MSAVEPPNPLLKSRLLVLGLGAAAVLLLAWQAGQLADPAVLGLNDYIAYWSAGRANALGGNPYSPEELLRLQREAGSREDWPNIMYYPPWALAVVMPFGLLPFGVSRMLWLLLNLALVLFCADRTWRFYRGPDRARPLAWLLALAFVPTLSVLRMGQVGPLMLLGLVGFLSFDRRRRGALAGAVVMLAAVKPQLVYLLGLAILVWALDRRRWSVLLGGILAAAAATGLALACNPLVLQQYRYALANPPAGNMTPTAGTLLRLAFGPERVWLQFLPSLAGVAWFAWYWFRHRRTWDWAEQIPLLILVSFLTTSYGGWVFDLVVLLLPVLQAAVWVAREPRRQPVLFAVSAYLAVDLLALALNLAGVSYPWFMWMTPAILLGYLALRRFSRRQEQNQPTGDGPWAGDESGSHLSAEPTSRMAMLGREASPR